MRSRTLLLYGSLLLTSLLACKENAFVKESVVDGLDKKVLYRSLTLPVSTVLYPDSVVTENDNLLFVGRHSSSVFGELQANAVTTFRPSGIADIRSIPEEVNSYDSIVFLLQISYTYGKKRGDFSLSIHPLKEKLTSRIYVAEQDVEYDEEVEVLRESTFYESKKVDSLRMHASQGWAEDVFEKLKSKDRNDVLLDYPGLILLSNSSNETLLGLDPEESNIIIYYTDPEEDTTITISLTLDGLRYNQLSVDRSEALLDLKRAAHKQLPKYAYAQSATGAFCAIDLSPVHTLYKELEGFDVHIARLSIGPLQDRSTSELSYPMADVLRLLLPYEDPEDIRNNSKNLRNRIIVNEDSQVGGSPFLGKVDKEGAVFVGNIAAALQREVSIDKENGYWLLSPKDPNHFEDIILPNEGVTLKLYYSLRK